MNRASLLRQLLRWQVLVTGVACLLLVAGTLFAGAFLIRHEQDSVLKTLTRTMCAGIRAEQDGEMRDAPTREAAEHYFGESPLEGHRLELWHRRDGLLVDRGEFPGLSAEVPAGGRSGACSSMPARSSRGHRGTVRACEFDCDPDHYVRVAVQDALTRPGIRRVGVVLIGFLPVALLVGGIAGRIVLGHLLRPLRQLTDAASEMAAGPTMALGVHAQPRELAQLEEAFDHLLQRVGSLVEREKRFSQEASHELRTPLTNLRLRLERLRDRTTIDATTHDQIQAAILDLDALDELMEALLLLSRSEASQLPKAPVNLCDLARESAANVAARRPADAPPVEVEAPDEILVHGNEELLLRAVENIVENAHKYAGDRATIRIRVEREADAGAISVEDDGPGIASDDRRYVFERFFRGPQTRGTQAGSGLGLAVVSTIVERHRGRIRTEPSRLGGEHVRMTIPLERTAASGDADSPLPTVT